MITDWDDAYDNVGHIEGAAAYPPRWAEEALAFRRVMAEAGRAELDLPYGEGPRACFDLFRPEGARRGLAVFVHGGYWKAFDKSYWSHLAAGAMTRGWTVGLPSYTLAPEARISDMTRQIGGAIEAMAGRVAGPIVLAGHSAGGHLVTRMACFGAPLSADVQARIAHVLSISGLHDLRPLRRTAMNQLLGLSESEAMAESPIMHEPVPGTNATIWVGANELSEFRRQAYLLANAWEGLGAQTRVVVSEGRHHFNVIDGLKESDSELIAALIAAGRECD